MTKEAIGALMFDLQTVRYCSPMLDLTVLLFNSCTYELRQKHLDEILSTYHGTIYKLLGEKLNKNIPEYYRYFTF